MYQTCLGLMHTAQGAVSGCSVCLSDPADVSCVSYQTSDLRLSTLIQMWGLPPLPHFVKSSCFPLPALQVLISSFLPP